MSRARNSRTGQALIVVGPIGAAGEPTLEEWKELRDAAFDELRKYPIPETLIQAVQDFQSHAEVAWVTEQGNPAQPNEAAMPVIQTQKRESKEEMRKILDQPRFNLDDFSEHPFPQTAGDALAAWLRPHLARLRRAKNAPVRADKMLPRSIIATIAMDILENNVLFGYVPGEELINLLKELLDVDKQKASADRQFAARYKASWILAQNENIPTRTLERFLGVNASSISRWRKEPAFLRMIQEKKQAIVGLESRGLWPAKLEDRGRSELTARPDALAQVRDVFEPSVKRAPARKLKGRSKGANARSGD
jgi:hypothetical protein